MECHILKLFKYYDLIENRNRRTTKRVAILRIRCCGSLCGMKLYVESEFEWHGTPSSEAEPGA